MTLPRGQPDERLTAIEAQVPGLLKHRNPSRVLSNSAWKMLPSQVNLHHLAHAHPLEGIVERCGYH
jgi:hypothetical protein